MQQQTGQPAQIIETLHAEIAVLEIQATNTLNLSRANPHQVFLGGRERLVELLGAELAGAVRVDRLEQQRENLGLDVANLSVAQRKTVK